MFQMIQLKKNHINIQNIKNINLHPKFVPLIEGIFFNIIKLENHWKFKS